MHIALGAVSPGSQLHFWGRFWTKGKTSVEARLAGCAQVVGPIQSTYWWKGKIERAEEWLCIMKTSKRLYPELEALIKRIHSYQVPEILATPVAAGNPDYLAWLEEELKPRK